MLIDDSFGGMRLHDLILHKDSDLKAGVIPLYDGCHWVLGRLNQAPQTNQDDEARRLIEELQNAINTINNQLTTINNAINDLTQRVTVLENKMVNVEDRLTAVENRLNQLDTKVTNLDTKITRIDNKVTHIDNKVTRIDNKVTQIDNKVTTIDNRVSQLEQQNNNLVQQINELRQLINNLQNNGAGHAASAEKWLTVQFNNESNKVINDAFVTADSVVDFVYLNGVPAADPITLVANGELEIDFRKPVTGNIKVQITKEA